MARRRSIWIAPHLDAKGVIFVGRTNLDHVTANAKSAAAEILATSY